MGRKAALPEDQWTNEYSDSFLDNKSLMFNLQSLINQTEREIECDGMPMYVIRDVIQRLGCRAGERKLQEQREQIEAMLAAKK